MLVYHKDPLGYTEIEGKRIYGRKFAYGKMPPAEISFAKYKENASCLETIPYTNTYLSRRFGGAFPPVEFHHVWDLLGLSWPNIVELAKAIGISYTKPMSATKDDKLGLAQAIIRILEQ